VRTSASPSLTLSSAPSPSSSSSSIMFMSSSSSSLFWRSMSLISEPYASLPSCRGRGRKRAGERGRMGCQGDGV
jgi:hypothetical protein